MNMRFLNLTLLAAVLLISTSLIAADSKVDLTGTWKLNVEKSDMGDQAPQSIVARVEKSDTVLKYAVNGKDRDGNSFEHNVETPIDGQPHDTEGGGMIALKWEGGVLLGDATSDEGLHEHFKISLSADKKTLTREIDTAGPGRSTHRREIYDLQ